MIKIHLLRQCIASLAAFLTLNIATNVWAETLLAGSVCTAPPRINCPESNCPRDAMADRGSATEQMTGRKFYLDFPCDLKADEKVTFILNLHGAGSIGTWQRHYFPVVDLKEKHRLVIATPTALQDDPPPRRWTAEGDDQYLHNVVDLVINQIGKENIERFWLAGHSQGGMTSRRIVCSDYFANKVDGFLSLSGGRVGSPPREGRPAPAPLNCDFSHIFTAGKLERSGQNVPETSTWAEKYSCDSRKRLNDITDTKAGYVTASDQSRGPSWGTFARPGVAEVFEFPNCNDGRIVADVVRLDKGHTEGLEPLVMDEIVQMMLKAKGGKLNAH